MKRALVAAAAALATQAAFAGLVLSEGIPPWLVWLMGLVLSE
jgi:hypothetical protein